MDHLLRIRRHRGAAKASDVGEGMIYLVCAIVLSWGGGLYHDAIDEQGGSREFRRGRGSLLVPRPAHIDVPWTGNDIIFGMVGALVALNLVANIVALALAPLFHLSITSNPSSGPLAVVTTIFDIVGYVAMVASVLAFRCCAAARGWLILAGADRSNQIGPTTHHSSPVAL